MFKKVYSLSFAFCTQPAFYSQSAVRILHTVCILPLVRSLQYAVHSLRFTLTAVSTHLQQKKSVVLLSNYSWTAKRLSMCLTLY